MRIVIDTNVMVSAFLNPLGTRARILRLIIQGNIEIILDERIVREYEIVLTRSKFQFIKKDVKLMLDFLRNISAFAPMYNGSVDLPDKGDELFLEAALAGKADALVTGNKKHFPKGKCKGMAILSPAEFIQAL